MKHSVTAYSSVMANVQNIVSLWLMEACGHLVGTLLLNIRFLKDALILNSLVVSLTSSIRAKNAQHHV